MQLTDEVVKGFEKARVYKVLAWVLWFAVMWACLTGPHNCSSDVL